jgi:molybdopterin synthase catalytic subunit
MNVRVRLFARLSEVLGERNVTLELPEGATVDDLRDQLSHRFPAVAPYLPTAVCAVDEEYVTRDHALREGDDVALIPPVSGGSEPGARNREPGTRDERAGGQGSRVTGDKEALFAVTREPLDAGRLTSLVRRDESGAVAVFLGVARNESEGRRVVALEYDAYPEMAARKLRAVADEARARWPITGMAIHHRIGRLAIGEASLVVAVSAGHRREAFAACEYAVDRVKQTVPIWKKEIWADGEGAWVAGHAVDVAEGMGARPPG